MYGIVENKKEPCTYKQVNSSMSVFFILYVNEIFLIENDILYIIGHKGFTVIIVLHKGFGKSILHPKDEIDLRGCLGYPSLCT